MSTYMMMPKDYARELMKQGNRDKASAFMEYVFDFDEKINNSISFYSSSWGKSKSTVHAWVAEFREKISEHFDFWTAQNEEKYRTLTERSPNDFRKKSNAKSTDNTSVKGIVPNAQPNDNRTTTELSVNTKNTKEEKEKKENKEKVLPSWLNKSIWADWVQHRKELKKPLTTTTIEKQLAFLEANRFEQEEIINQSIQNSWSGLFAIKKTTQQKSLAQRNSEAINQYLSAFKQEEIINAEIN